jgi:Family of unknown function (DUF6049)
VPAVRAISRVVCCGALLLVCTTLAAGGAAQAQVGSGPVVTLARQTPWITPDKAEFDAEVRLANETSAPLARLALRVTVYPQVTTRSEFEQRLVSDPPVAPVKTHLETYSGAAGAGTDRTLRTGFDLSRSGISTTHSYVYPVKFDVLSAGAVVGTLRSDLVVFVDKAAETPLVVDPQVQLTWPWDVAPDGVFRTDHLARSIQHGGRLRSTVDALAAAAKGGSAVDVVVSPLLLAQLQAMTDGFQVVSGDGVRTVAKGEGGALAAVTVLGELRAVAGASGTEVVALPFSAPTMPSLLGGLSRDLAIQLEQGRATVGQLMGKPESGVEAPVGSAVDGPVLDRLAAGGARTLLLNADAVPRPAQDNGFAGPATSVLHTENGDPLQAVVPEPAVQTFLTSETARDDPVLAAQQAFGELGAIWQESPKIPRGVAIGLPPEAPAALAPAMLHRVAKAPFLHPSTAGRIAAAKQLARDDTPADVVQLDDRTFTSGYTDSIKAARRLLDGFRSILLKPDPLATLLAQQLLVAEGSQFLSDETAGAEYVRATVDGVDAQLAKIQPQTSSLVTLSSRRGTIPVHVVNTTGDPVRVRVELVSSHLAPGPSYSRSIVLSDERTLNFSVVLATTGQFPVQVLVAAPDGRAISQTTIQIRSTAYSRIALLITIGAAIALLALWGRRYLPSRRTS